MSQFKKYDVCIKKIKKKHLRVLQRLIGQMSAISTLFLLLTGNMGEYLRVVGIHNDG